MPTLILSPRHSEDSDALEGATIRAGWRVFRPDGWRIPTDFADAEGLALYGEALFVRVIADQVGVTLLEASHDWLAQLPKSYTKRSVIATTLGAAHQLELPAFIKPAGDKAFESKVFVSAPELAAITHDLSGQIDILVSEPVNWEAEFRSFVLDDSVVTVSPYMLNGELAKTDDGVWQHDPSLEEEAQSFAAQMLAASEVPFPPAFVLDLGIISSQGWAVLEANPAWGSGIYGCDPDHAFQVIRRACLLPNQITDADRSWISEWESWDV